MVSFILIVICRVAARTRIGDLSERPELKKTSRKEAKILIELYQSWARDRWIKEELDYLLAVTLDVHTNFDDILIFDKPLKFNRKT
jgi:hypothetical protein